MATIGIDDNRFNEIIDEILIKKCENCGDIEIEEGAIFNYCSQCFNEYVENLDKEWRDEKRKIG